MKPLDVINCVDFGYRLAWAERRYFLRLAIVPLMVKLVCLVVLVLLGWEQHYLRMALVMLPSFFTEGWMLAHITRLIFHGQRWPFRGTGDRAADEILLLDRAQGVMAGTVFYVVIKFLMTGLLSLVNNMQLSAESEMAVIAQTQAQPSPGIFFAALALVVATLWGFRFIFLYIPAAAGMNFRLITRSRQSFLLSLQMLGTWMVCFVPFALLALMVTSMVIPADAGQTLPAATRALLIILQVSIDTLIAIVSTASIAAGLRNMVEKSAAKR